MRSPWTLFLLTLFFSTSLQLFLPWWSLAVAALVLSALLACRGGHAFWAGFGGVALSWLLPALYFYQRNDGILANRVAGLLPLGGNGWAVAVVGAVLVGIVGGLAALTGYWLRQTMRPSNGRTAAS